VTVTFLKKYSSFLFTQLKNSKNTIHSSIKVIRKLFNEAVTEGIIDSGQNPFLRYKLTTEPTSITYLTEEEIVRIEDLQLAPRSRISQHRDIFIFACFACGLRISDLLTLEWHNFNGTHLDLTMRKTGRQITIPLPQKAIQIIKSFGKSKTRSHGKIFPFLKDTAATPMEMNSAVSSATAYLNKNLRKIARMASIDKRISIGISRHTWATRALRKGMRAEYVSRLLGHINIRTTQLYTAIVDTELDKAMEIFNI
jgi:site-specific recombinase XerD